MRMRLYFKVDTVVNPHSLVSTFHLHFCDFLIPIVPNLKDITANSHKRDENSVQSFKKNNIF